MTSPLPASLARQTVAVFGASSGIGLAVARGAHALGARVIAVGRDRARLAAALGDLPSNSRWPTSRTRPRWARCCATRARSTTWS